MKRYTPTTLKTVQKLITAGLTDKEIAKRTKVKVFSVRYYRKAKPTTTRTRATKTATTTSLQTTLTKVIRELQTARAQLG